jgi:hypothetical protein
MEVPMKTLLFGLAFLGFSATAALGDVTKDEVKALLRIGTSDAVIRSYVEAHRPVQPLSADDLRDLRAAGASDDLLVFLITPPVPPAAPSVTDSTGNPYGYEDYGTYYPSYSYPYPYYPNYDYYYPYYPYYYPGFGFSFVVPSHFHHDIHHDIHHSFVQHPLPRTQPGGSVTPPMHGNFGGQGGMGGHGGGGHH